MSIVIKSCFYNPTVTEKNNVTLYISSKEKLDKIETVAKERLDKMIKISGVHKSENPSKIDLYEFVDPTAYVKRVSYEFANDAQFINLADATNPSIVEKAVAQQTIQQMLNEGAPVEFYDLNNDKVYCMLKTGLIPGEFFDPLATNTPAQTPKTSSDPTTQNDNPNTTSASNRKKMMYVALLLVGIMIASAYYLHSLQTPPASIMRKSIARH
jgi:hypothetical protein